MQLKNNLYTITDKETNGNDCSFTLSLIKDCVIYKAHFPEKPITPGVCITQIAKELAEETLNCCLTLVKVKNVKFISIINPLETQSVVYDIKNIKQADGVVSFQAVARDQDNIFAKISIVCTICNR
ncbi:MAG: hydroxymyristoyl-ACP dehydratase [Prevotella sp.]|nr:hydroxymyristoyl-ACP dehydratase [Candidatus Prevotella equi]